MRLTGINGALGDTVVGEVWGRFGRGERPLVASGGVPDDFEPFGPLPGVEGYDDRRRGVPFMACYTLEPGPLGHSPRFC